MVSPASGGIDTSTDAADATTSCGWPPRDGACFSSRAGATLVVDTPHPAGDQGRDIMRRKVIVLAAALLIAAPVGVKAADLVVWWDRGFNPEEDAAIREIVAAFEQDSGKDVEIVFHPKEEHPGRIASALEVGQPPDFAFGYDVTSHIGRWAFDDRLVDLADATGHFSDLFDPDVLNAAMWVNGSSGQEAL
jgi:multiple sugar transport system substrate-binding protein